MKTFVQTLMIALALSFNVSADEALDLADRQSIETNGQSYKGHSVYGVIPEGTKAYALINYKMVNVDCRGLGYRYTETRDKTEAKILVTKRFVPRPAVPCHNLGLKKVQGGVKVELKSAPNGGGRVSTEIVVPAGSTVEVINIEDEETGGN